MDALLLASLSVMLGLFSIIGGFIFKLWWDERTAKQSRAALVAMGIAGRTTANEADGDGQERQAGGAARRRRPFARAPEPQQEDNGSDGDGRQAEGDSPPPAGGAAFDGPKIGKKKQAKLQAKAEAKAQREQDQQERLERKRQEEIKAKQDEQQRLVEEAEEQQRQEQVRKEREERKRREQEEYERLKAGFTVEEEGVDRLEGEETEENLIQVFVEHVKRTKVVYVDELASRFRLSAEETVNRLQTLVGDGHLTGVFDERGKFIYVTEDELRSVAKFINQRGRVSLHELAEYSNRLIRLDPEETAASG